ncbi:MAG: hypothetical protein IBX71_11275, partial [Candidatus Desulforudis sp.]|nr:hypothetical protein [Desulforudis sp.]
MKRIILLMVIAFCGLGLVLLAGCGGDGADKATVVKIGKAPYDYEDPVLAVTRQIAVEQGYEVEVVEGDIGFMFLSLAQGDTDIWPGIWLPSIHGTYLSRYGDSFELGSAIFENAPLGWAVPQYVEVDSIADLKGNEDVVNGKLYGLEPGCGMMLVSQEIIDGYGLDLELIGGSLPSMMAEVDYAFKQHQPIAFLAWRPHTMFRNYKIKILDDPEGYWAYDSEYWGIGEGFAEKAPDLYNFCKNFKMNIE